MQFKYFKWIVRLTDQQSVQCEGKSLNEWCFVSSGNYTVGATLVPRMYDYVLSVWPIDSIFVMLKEKTLEWPLLVSTDQTTVSLIQMLLSQLKPCTAACSQSSVPWDREAKGQDHSEDTRARTHTCTHTRKKTGLQGHETDGKMHSFTWCCFQIAVILFWFLVVLEFNSRSHT